MVVLDVSELIENPVRTGIQRVARELIRHWPAQIPMRVSRFDGVGLQPVPEAVIDILADRAGEDEASNADVRTRIARALEGRAFPLPHAGRSFVPEVFFSDARCNFYLRRLRAGPESVGFIAFDFIPWLRPDLIGVTGTAPLMPYLRLLRLSRTLAFISDCTRQEYLSRITRGRGATGPVLRLGCDGLQLRKQEFSPGRRAFVCIGSIDGRKNQHRIVEAFQILWGQGHEVPLVLVGSAFDSVDTSQIRAAVGHPLFSWHSTASDGDIRRILGTARATLYMSESEGYGIPPVESLYAGIPVISTHGVPSMAELPPGGRVLVDRATPEAIAQAVLVLAQDDAAARLWTEAATLELSTWGTFAQQAANWIWES